MGASLRFGILGTGWIARKFADDLVWAKGCSLTAAASRDIGKAREFAGACPGFPGLKAYGSYEELVASPDVDIVYVATPHNRHREDALLSLEAGKHVLVEKRSLRHGGALDTFPSGRDEPNREGPLRGHRRADDGRGRPVLPA
jgi:hypothetical protein